ncbi:MAG: EF-Tu/IF-2/RF-3 family GTPase [Candidatus Verstraetearchaeota archaeon]|nr:EF-Tu/IF-2/RF-3 family GTPase [Candidatus Verstraetearchaeota archaeon]
MAVLEKPGFAAELGKKGTSSDITFYNLKRGEDTVTFIEPTKYPERLSPLFYAVSMAKTAAVVAVEEQVGSTFGETALMLHSAGVEDGYLVVSEGNKEKVTRLVRGTVLEKYRIFGEEPAMLREELLKRASLSDSRGVSSNVGCVAVDHAFNVRGTGTVALGTVMSGVVKRHDVLRVLPEGKTAQVRSIQKHDDEYEYAVEGDRVGLALKGVEVEDLERGTLLTNDGSIKTANTLVGMAEIHRYWQHPLKDSTVVHLGHWVQFVQGRVETAAVVEEEGKGAVSGGQAGNGGAGWRRMKLSISLGKPLSFLPGSSCVIMQLDGGKLRVVGRMVLS